MRHSIGYVILFALTCLPFQSTHAQNFDHFLFDSLLNAHVENGLVDYPGLMKDGAGFMRYCRQLRSVELQDFLSWPEKERKAFWINAHNAITLVGVIRHLPTNKSGQPMVYKARNFSVQSIPNFRDTVFMKLLGMNVTLNQIRDEILHDEYPDMRVYFALVLAAKGGPLFPERVFTADNIDSLLNVSTIKFINNPDYVRLDRETNTLHLSSLLRWYKSEFARLNRKGLKWVEYRRDLRGVMDIVYSLLPPADRSFIRKYNPRIHWMQFDWSLNLASK